MERWTEGRGMALQILSGLTRFAAVLVRLLGFMHVGKLDTHKLAFVGGEGAPSPGWLLQRDSFPGSFPKLASFSSSPNNIT